MGKDPAFLFYPGDWLGGTMGMTFEEKGCYIELLMMQFNLGQFTEAQAKQVLSICYPVAWATLKQKFSTDGTYFWNERLRIEIEKRRKFTESRRSNALSSSDKRDMVEHMQEHMPTHMENENINRNKDVIEVKDKRIVKEKRESDFLDEVINQFTEVYEEIRGDEYLITNRGKERAAAGKLLAIYKAKNPDQTADETLAGMRAYFARCAGITDQWLYDNMSLTIINSKLNEINTVLRNGNQRRNGKGGATDAELAAVIAKHFGQ